MLYTQTQEIYTYIYTTFHIHKYTTRVHTLKGQTLRTIQICRRQILQYSLITIKVNESYNKAAYIFVQYIYIRTVHTYMNICDRCGKEHACVGCIERTSMVETGAKQQPLWRVRARYFICCILERELHFFGVVCRLAI